MALAANATVRWLFMKKQLFKIFVYWLVVCVPLIAVNNLAFDLSWCIVSLVGLAFLESHLTKRQPDKGGRW